MILRTDGTPVGTIISSGLAGYSAPRGAPCGLVYAGHRRTAKDPASS
jgi:hypothetical protein